MPKVDNLTCGLVTPDNKKPNFEAEITGTGEIMWNKKVLAPVKFEMNKPYPCLYAKVFENKTLARDVLLGEVWINWTECISFPNELSVHKAFLLYKGDFKEKTTQKLYLGYRFIPTSTAKSMGIDSKGGIANLADSYETGTLKIDVVRAKGVKADETSGGKGVSDPYAIVTFKASKGDKGQKFQTKEKSKTLDPEWRESFKMQIKFPKGGLPPPLEVEVKDHDAMSFDDTLGVCAIPIEPVLKKPCTWAINTYHDLKPTADDIKKGGDAVNDLGKIYIRCYYIPEGSTNEMERPIDIDTGYADADDNVDGTLQIRAYYAEDLLYIKTVKGQRVPQQE